MIGKNTVESLESGIIYGFAAQVEGIAQRMARELSPDDPRAVTTIATGRPQLPTDSAEVLPGCLRSSRARARRSWTAPWRHDQARAHSSRARDQEANRLQRGVRGLLGKAIATLYEDVQEFCVAELSAGATVGDCGALHVMWEDLAEIRTVAVRDDCQGIGHAIVDALLRHARAVGVSRVFCLTFAVDFFRRHGFQPISGTPVAAEVYRELLRSYDEAWRSFSTWSG